MYSRQGFSLKFERSIEMADLKEDREEGFDISTLLYQDQKMSWFSKDRKRLFLWHVSR